MIKKTSLGSSAAALGIFALALAVFIVGLSNTGEAVEGNGRRVAEEAVRRAAVTCYALEGTYPESYAYLKEHYGLAVNESLYHVNYTIFASNLMPDITVIELGGL